MHKVEKASSRRELLLQMQSLSDPTISEYIQQLRAKYGRYALPVEDLRRILDKEMGATTLTDILYQMREEAP